MKEDLKNVVLVNSYMLLLSLCSDLCHSWVDFSGLQLTSTIDALSWLRGELVWIWYNLRHNVVSFYFFFFSFRGWHGSSFRAGSMLRKFEEASENQKDKEFGSGTATVLHREAVWGWGSAGSFEPYWTQLTFTLRHMGVYSTLACPVLLDCWDFFIISVLIYHKCWKLIAFHVQYSWKKKSFKK